MSRVVREETRGERRSAADVREVRSDLADHARIAANRVTTETGALPLHEELRATRRITEGITVLDVSGQGRRGQRVRGHALARETDEPGLCHCRLCTRRRIRRNA